MGRRRYAATVTFGGKRRYFYGRTRTEARRKRDEFLRAVGPRPAGEDPTLADYLGRWLEFTSRLHSPTTAADRACLIRTHILPAPEAAKRLSALTPADVAALCARIPGRSRADKAFRTLHAALADAVRVFRILRENPAAQAPRPAPPRPERRFLSEAEARSLLKAVFEDPDPRAAFIGLVLGTGLRRSEALALSWEDVDLETGILRVRRGLVFVQGRPLVREPKTPGSAREVALADWVRDLLERLPGPRTGPVFAGLGTKGLYRKLRDLSRRAGVPYVGLHGLRHTAASFAILQGVPIPEVARVLGHSSPQVTASVYAHAVSRLGAGLVARALGSLATGGVSDTVGT